MKKITRSESLDITRNTLEKAESEREEILITEAEKGIQILDTLWLVGQAFTDYHPQAWEFVGVFSTKEKAIEACESERYFYAPVEIDKGRPDEMAPLLNCFFPKGNGFPE
jgi:hypothetical protein